MNLVSDKLQAGRDYEVFNYDPSNAYILVLSGDAIDLEESKKMVRYFNVIGARNVTMLHVQKGIKIDDAVKFIKIPVSLFVRIKNIKNNLWRMLRGRIV